MSSKLKIISSRVDFQVLMIVLTYTLFACFITTRIFWEYSMDLMVDSHSKRAVALYESVEEFIAEEAFYEINHRDDYDGELYQDSKYALTNMKLATDVMYLFTAKLDENGNCVYLVDGYEDVDSEEFRFPYDPIEEEIVPHMEIALTDEIVMTDTILHTDWGDIFMAYFPYHGSNGEVLGVVGIEFDATENYADYQALQGRTLGLCLLMVVSAGFLTVFLFRRISNPLYLDKNNQDTLTAMKNRNSYELDLNNMTAKAISSDVGVIVADINGLKEVNDRLGHDYGDSYIRLVAESINALKSKTMVAYRTGGDEFVIIETRGTEESLKIFVEKCTENVKNQKFDTMRCSVACGYTMYKPSRDKSIRETIKRADKFMYNEKQRQKQSSER